MELDYEPLDLNEIASESERANTETEFQEGSKGNDKYVVLPEKDGYTTLRLLPRKRGFNLFCATRMHRLINPSNGYSKNLHCPKELVMTKYGPKWQGECIICKYVSDLWDQIKALPETEAGKREAAILKKKARDLKAFEKYYYNAIVRTERDKEGNVKTNVGPKIYSCGVKVHAKIMRAMVGDKKAGEKALGDITHPLNGRDLRVVKKIVKSDGFEFPNYDQSAFEDPSALGENQQMETWLNNLHDLSALRVVKTDQELRHELKVHLGLIKETGKNNKEDLAEFRGERVVTEPDSEVNENLVSSGVSATKVEVKKADEEEVLADDDFMNKMNNL